MMRVCLHITGAALFAAQSLAYASDTGEQLFKQCQVCHAIGPGAAHQIGPHLNGLGERPAGALDDYDYSAAFATVARAGGGWSKEALDTFLQAPMENVPGTKMAFLGVKDDEERAVLVEWLLDVGLDGVMPEVVKPVKVSKPSLPATPRIAAADMPIPEHGVLHLGRAALDEEVDAWNIDIRPDGQGLPAGLGSVETGGEIYDAQCAVCHGVFGEGAGRWPILAGGDDTLEDDRPEKTIGSYWPYLSTVYDYVKRAMAFGNARSLSDDDVYALTAYLLYLNDLVEDDFELGADNFTSVSLPNQTNFIEDNRNAEPHYAVVAEPCMQNCKPDAAVVTQRARVLDVTPDTEDDDSSGSISID
ncbi:MAG: c-type cytochrome [Granulosicoccus sp.]